MDGLQRPSSKGTSLKSHSGKCAESLFQAQKVTVPQDDCILPEVTWQLSVRTLESRGSSGDITLKLGTQSTAAQYLKVPSLLSGCFI